MTTQLHGRFTPTWQQRLQVLATGRGARIAAISSATIPNYAMYGGATVTSQHDKSGAVFVGACAKKLSTNYFGFFIWKNDVEVMQGPTGRGSIWTSLFDGIMYWTAWEGSSRLEGKVPFAAAFPPSGSAYGKAVPIPPDSIINELWLIPYTPAEVDTPQEIAPKFTKTNEIIAAILDLLKKAGVLI